MNRRPVIIEAAINGATRPTTNPNVPRTPAAIAHCGLNCLDRGAAIVHNHNDDPNVGGPARHDPEPYAEAWTEILARRPDALLHPTVRGMSEDAPIEERYRHLDVLYERGLLPMASADPGVVTVGSFVYGNSPADASYMFEWCRARGRPVHVSVFEPGFLRATLNHLEAGTLPEQVKVQLYFGDAVPFGLPPTAASLDAYLALLEGTGLTWMVGVMGGDVVGCGLAALAIEQGGHVRVGLEDHRSAATPSNEELVTTAVQLVHDLGAEVATPAQTLELLAERG